MREPNAAESRQLHVKRWAAIVMGDEAAGPRISEPWPATMQFRRIAAADGHA